MFLFFIGFVVGVVVSTAIEYHVWKKYYGGRMPRRISDDPNPDDPYTDLFV